MYMTALLSFQHEALGPGNGRFEVVNISLVDDGRCRITVHGFQFKSNAATEDILFAADETGPHAVFHRHIEFEVNLELMEAVSEVIAAKVADRSPHYLLDIV